MTRGRWNAFAVLFVVAGAGHVLLIGSAPSPVTAFVKIVPILMLLGRALSGATTRQRLFLALGLVCSLVGDVLLELFAQRLFVQGVATFLAAHVLYILAFRPDIRYSRRSLAPAALVVGWCGAAGAILLPHLGPLRLPVLAYMLVITAMGVSAAFTTRGRTVLVLGAFSFIASDTLLALNRFVAPIPLAPYLVMVTYYFGQFFIVAGMLSAREAAAPSPRQPI